MNNNILQLCVELSKAMLIARDPSRVVKNQIHDLDYLSAGTASIFGLKLAQTAINYDIVVVVTEEPVLRPIVGHQHSDRLHRLVEAVHGSTNSQVEQLFLVLLLPSQELIEH